jgi:hypothetical protein
LSPSTPTQQIQAELAFGVVFVFMSLGFDVLGFVKTLQSSVPSLAFVVAASVGIDGAAVYLGLTTRDNACQ